MKCDICDSQVDVPVDPTFTVNVEPEGKVNVVVRGCTYLVCKECAKRIIVELVQMGFSQEPGETFPKIYKKGEQPKS